MSEESERVKYLLKYWSHLQLAREYEQLESIIKEVRELCENQFIMWEVNNLGDKIKIYAPISTDKIMEILDKDKM